MSRTQFVFLRACGCPGGVVEGSYAKTEDAAWDIFAESRQEERDLRRAGVTVVHVSHEDYSAKYYPLMLARCGHGGAP